MKRFEFNPQVYVGTYEKYNNGDLYGKWVKLRDFSNKDEFIDYCRKLHKDEKEPEFMFQDFDDVPCNYISESHINPELWDLFEYSDEEIILDYINFQRTIGNENVSIEEFLDSYIGEFYTLYDFGVEMFFQNYSLNDDIAEVVDCFFDFEAYGKSLLVYDVICLDNSKYYWAIR